MDNELLEYMSRVEGYYVEEPKLNIQEKYHLLMGMQSPSGSDSGMYNLRNLERSKNDNNKLYEVNTYWTITSHRKYIGKLIVFCKKTVRKLLKWLINPLVEQQNEYNRSVSVSINELYNYALHMNQMESKIKDELDFLKFSMEQKGKKYVTVDMSNQEMALDAIQERNEDTAQTLKTYGIDYFEFENRFRGTRDEIKNRQVAYLKYFKDKKNILDIGCGRGEFLELLDSFGMKAKGIDVCEEFVNYCSYKNLDVSNIDAITYLDNQKAASIGGIFMSHVVEHMETEYLIKFLSKAYSKLEEGAYFIAETPNPTMLSTFSNSFYLDPSHNKPVHPETLKFILEKAGFKSIEIVFTEASKIKHGLPMLKGESVQNIEEFNEGITRLNNLLFGSQDYAIVAKK